MTTKMFRWSMVAAGSSLIYFAGMLRMAEHQAQEDKKKEVRA